MNDDIAGVDQHPIALALALDRDPAGNRLFEVIGQRRYLPRRPAARDDHVIGNRRLAGEIDRDDVLRLAVLETVDDAAEQVGRAG